MPLTLRALADLGFVLVGRFINSNSDSTCYVFHHIDRRLPLENLPFNWPGMVINSRLEGDLPQPGEMPRRHRNTNPAATAPVPHTKILSFYHNVYRVTGRSDMAHSTIENCRAVLHADRAIRIDRHDLFCDGTTEWVEGVDE